MLQSLLSKVIVKETSELTVCVLVEARSSLDNTYSCIEMRRNVTCLRSRKQVYSLFNFFFKRRETLNTKISRGTATTAQHNPLAAYTHNIRQKLGLFMYISMYWLIHVRMLLDKTSICKLTFKTFKFLSEEFC